MASNSGSFQKEDSSNKNNWTFYLLSGLTGLALGAGIATWMNKPEKVARQGVGDLREDRTCVICINNERKNILLPCRHFCLCDECSNKVSDCPICRAPIKSVEVVYSV